MEKLLTDGELAEALGLSQQTLANWRWSGDGPPYLKINGAVRYRPSAVELWLEQKEQESTADNRRPQRKRGARGIE